MVDRAAIFAMKICVLVPSDRYLTYAGFRIRYRRIEDALLDLGHQINYSVVDDFDAVQLAESDIYIISKCHSVNANIVSHLATRMGKKIGIDLFDDYFSQRADSRLIRQRAWLQSMIPMVDFITCSTPAMQTTIREYTPTLPVHVMSDPSEPLSENRINEALRNKLEYAHQTRVVNVGWFGIGSNPNFPVGLRDLVAFGAELTALAQSSFQIHLDILTDLRAMNDDGFALVRRLSVPYTLEEWTDERERALLTRSLVCFLPVNGQNFSTAKSLNRAVSALAAGAQVFSSGYPLYETLSPFIYRDSRRLLTDIQLRALAARTETVPSLVELLSKLSSPETETQRYANFLAAQMQGTTHNLPPARSAILTAVIHGTHLDREVREFTQQAGYLTVSSPFTGPESNADIRFQISAVGRLEVYVSNQWVSHIPSRILARVVPHCEGGYLRMSASSLAPGLTSYAFALARLESPFGLIASYADLMADVAKVLQVLFPSIVCFFSDQTKLPVGLIADRDILKRRPVQRRTNFSVE